jgi:gas vesicle protein
MRRLMFFVGGLACGALIGASVALLLTPESGHAMRTDARERVNGAMAEARKASNKRRQELEAELAQMTSPAGSTAIRTR